ncbi:MAG: SMP-30/gluconolactonase/LRE family protein [Roseibium sp.]|nr:SMP-30/gluconolactonase/LRE family protein [Roseibium sp.]
MTAVSVYDDRLCTLGEGPLWHPERGQLFWFDILQNRLLSRDGETALEWRFSEHVSAAGWIDHDRLLIASETQLFAFNLLSGQSDHICALEADQSGTRSNDGRADPQGGFWIGTMGKHAEAGMGAIYRYHRGELRKLFSGITISNAICFAPGGGLAYVTDTVTQVINKVRLDGNGWPAAQPEPHIDLRSEDLNPDGAVVDADGCLWNAQWGAHRIARYNTHGAFVGDIIFPAGQISCPAFGGPDLTTLFATSAQEGMDGTDDGLTYFARTASRGVAEPRVQL